MILECVNFKNKKLESLKKEIENLKEKVMLAIIQVGDNPSSNKYVNNKIKTCNNIGIETTLIKLDTEANTGQVIEVVETFNSLKKCNGIIVQLPLPKHIDVETVLQSINPLKDIDCLTNENIGKLHSGNPFIYPCTPLGCVEILEEMMGVDLAGKNVLILGRSNIVGRPLASMLEQKNSTVTLAHSKSKLDYNRYDIIISAIGKPKQIVINNPSAILIDVGINFDESGKMCGDFDLENSRYKIATPVPKGVGAITCMEVCNNVIKLYRKQRGE